MKQNTYLSLQITLFYFINKNRNNENEKKNNIKIILLKYIKKFK
jgi:hypothetical protein